MANYQQREISLKARKRGCHLVSNEVRGYFYVLGQLKLAIGFLILRPRRPKELVSLPLVVFVRHSLRIICCVADSAANRSNAELVQYWHVQHLL